MQKKTSVCFILCFFVVFKTVLFFATTATGRAGPNWKRAGPGWAWSSWNGNGPGLSWTGRAEKNGPVQASTMKLQELSTVHDMP